ncbi:MAG TPA: polysaccharide deacetylase family protein [Allosphingosinicella sp.]|nr:polysaccharide deacetylase family protein [Allosphingosinicella sp.]
MGIARNLVKRSAFHVLGSAPVLKRRLDAVQRSGAVTILNLHRVFRDDGSDYRPLDPSLFDDLLAYIRRRFVVTTFAELAELGSPAPKMILSFDDGYKDFLTTAVPLLEKHRIKVNQNVIPECIESQLPPLNVVAQDFVGRAPDELVARLDIPGFDAPKDRGRLGPRLSAFIKNRAHAAQDELRAYLLPQFQAWDGFAPTPMMTREEVRQIGAVHELGGHSFAHASMEFETDDYLRDDVARCCSYFAERLGQEMTIYAFPNGSCRPNQIDIVREAGIDHVLLVGEDFDRDARVHRRFTFDARSRSELRFKALGGMAAIAA